MTDNEVKWLIVGKFLRRNLMAVKGEPVAYSYNGVVLPKLPEWDKETYPYAVIATANDSIHLFCCASPYPYAYETDGVESVRLSSNPDILFVVNMPNNNAWGAGYEWKLGLSVLKDNVIWTNVDILNPDGTIAVPKSPNPIPVYE